MYFTLLLSIIWITSVDCGFESSDFVKYHNYYRSKETRATNMKRMRWDWSIARQAFKWASQCVWDHSPRQVRRTSKYSYLGENMHYTTGSSANAENVVKAWYSERQYYNFGDNSCKSGKSCGHYTQVVWAKSEALGCYIRKCYSLKKSLSSSPKTLKNPIQLAVCMYGPGGNYRGVRPYEIKPGNNGCTCKRDLAPNTTDLNEGSVEVSLKQMDSTFIDASDDNIADDTMSLEARNAFSLTANDDSLHTESLSSPENEDDADKEKLISFLAKAIISRGADD